jgi:hypothetical protein
LHYFMTVPHSHDKGLEKGELQAKRVAYYSALVSARIQNNMERDRALLTLSLAAIGFLITIVGQRGGIAEWFRMVSFAGAFICFGMCILFILKVFKLNADYIDNEITEGDNSKLNLAAYDRAVSRSFLLGVFFLCVIGLNAGVVAIVSREEGGRVVEKTQPPRASREPEGRESLQGLNELRPTARDGARHTGGVTVSNENKVSQEEMQRSIDGLSKLKPERTQGQNQSGNQSQAGSQSSGKNEEKK